MLSFLAVFMINEHSDKYFNTIILHMRRERDSLRRIISIIAIALLKYILPA